MRVLGIAGSARKEGNTEIMTQEALAAARESGAETDIFLIHDKKIEGCDACGACFRTGACKIKDDMTELYRRMEAADGILFGSPVYFHGVTAQAKAVMDRTFCYLRNRKLKGKVGASGLGLGRVGASQTRVHLYAWFLSQGMVPLRGAIGYGREKGDVKTGDGAGIGMTALEEARATGQEVVEMIKKLGGK